MLTNISRVGVRRMGPNSFQWCPVTGQGAMGTNQSIGSSVWTWGRTTSLWVWWSTGTGCPGTSWNLLLWRYSRLAWTRSCAACCRRLWFGRGVGLNDPQRSLPSPTILWFCNVTFRDKLSQVRRHQVGLAHCPVPLMATIKTALYLDIMWRRISFCSPELLRTFREVCVKQLLWKVHSSSKFTLFHLSPTVNGVVSLLP